MYLAHHAYSCKCRKCNSPKNTFQWPQSLNSYSVYSHFACYHQGFECKRSLPYIFGQNHLTAKSETSPYPRPTGEKSAHSTSPLTFARDTSIHKTVASKGSTRFLFPHTDSRTSHATPASPTRFPRCQSHITILLCMSISYIYGRQAPEPYRSKTTQNSPLKHGARNIPHRRYQCDLPLLQAACMQTLLRDLPHLLTTYRSSD